VGRLHGRGIIGLIRGAFICDRLQIDKIERNAALAFSL
jgi:hypothetical protein